MNTTAPERPRREATWPRSRNPSRAWAWLQKALTILVSAAAAITGLQLGLHAPAVSPVQPTTVAATVNDSSLGAAPNQQALPAPARDRTARGRGRGGR
jgi:ABC-type Fe2+-enterobactin transport system substrate-binding protein